MVSPILASQSTGRGLRLSATNSPTLASVTSIHLCLSPGRLRISIIQIDSFYCTHKHATFQPGRALPVFRRWEARPSDAIISTATAESGIRRHDILITSPKPPNLGDHYGSWEDLLRSCFSLPPAATEDRQRHQQAALSKSNE